MRIARRVALFLVSILIPFILIGGGFAVWIWSGVGTQVARTGGTVDDLSVGAPVRIVRDDRGVPHVRAASLHDAYFGEGYATGSDRLFQIDLTRRYAQGRLAEVFGGAAMEADRTARVVDVRRISDDAFARLAPADRAALIAFTDGINAAATHEPLPVEYRALGLRFESWRPQDSLAVAFATVLTLSDTWTGVIARDAVLRATGAAGRDAFFSTSDPAWSVPVELGAAPAPVAPLPALAGARVASAPGGRAASGDVGSNAWAAGAARTASGRALLANDPHLARSMPGIWYLVDVQAPGFHVAGATLAGVPGVLLGHNDAVAWGATDAYAASPRVFRETFTTADGATYRAGNATLTGQTRIETFNNRLGNPEHRTYVRTRHGFVVENDGIERHAVQWDADVAPDLGLGAFLALDRARSVDDALRALARLPGPTLNVVLAGRDGRVAYTMAGHVPAGPDAGLRVADGATTAPAPLRFIPFAQLPHAAPARTLVLLNANNQPYGPAYPERIGPVFAAPYRAAEIAARLRAVPRADVATYRAIQADTVSVAERELAGWIVAAVRRSHADENADVATVARDLAPFARGGAVDSDSVGATLAQRIREVATYDLAAEHLPATVVSGYLSSPGAPGYVTLMRALRTSPHGWFPRDNRDAWLAAQVHEAITLWGGLDRMAQPYGEAYPVTARHALAAFGFHAWDGPPQPGRGGSYAPAVQGLVLGQSFRAVWDVGAWDSGGIALPVGESGEPGSPHYRDLASGFAAGVLTPLPYSAAAVARAARSTLVLTP